MVEVNPPEVTMKMVTLAQFVAREQDRDEAAHRDEDLLAVAAETAEVIEGDRNGIVPIEIEEQQRTILLNLTCRPIKWKKNQFAHFIWRESAQGEMIALTLMLLFHLAKWNFVSSI